jgi:antitoxin VapB
MARARVFRSGNGQAVQLPKGFRFKSKEVEIFRRGDEFVLRQKPRGLGRVVDIISELPEDFGELITPDGPPQKRRGL